MLSKEKHQKYALTEMLKVRGLKKKDISGKQKPKEKQNSRFYYQNIINIRWDRCHDRKVTITRNILNIHLLTRQTSKCTKQKLTEIHGEIHKSIITAGDVNILAAVIDSVRKLDKGIDHFDNTVNGLQLMTLYKHRSSKYRKHVLFFLILIFFSQKLAT